MVDYRKLSDFEKAKVDKRMLEEIEPKRNVNRHNGFEFHEPQYTIARVHSGEYCADCLMIHYNCLCDQD